MPDTSLPFVLTLQGGSNFRDLGGYKTEDGRTVRRNTVFRSA
ncbi:MAG: protein-tyrosine-phosphatase, partial [Reyranella sp.]